MLNTQNKQIGKGKKLFIKDTYRSILTTGPLAGRPAFFIKFGNKKTGKKVKVGALLKSIISNNNTHLCVLIGDEDTSTDTMDQNIAPLVTGIIRAGMYMQLNTNGISNNTEVPWMQESIFVVVTPITKNISPEIATRALAFQYAISASNKNANDGLPNGVYRPTSKARIMVYPEWNDNKKIYKNNIRATVETTLEFGYYFALPTNKLIGLK